MPVDIRKFMQDNNLQYLLVNTTNEFLVEYNTLDDNSLYKITGFTGSTGYALVTLDKIYLFVDGRYHIQADLEVNSKNVNVIKVNSVQLETLIPEFSNILPEGSVLGLFSKKNSINDVWLIEKSYQDKLLDDPFDDDTKGITFDANEEVNSGCTSSEKFIAYTDLYKIKDNEIIYITELGEVSYLFNIRNYSVPYTAFVKGKALLYKNNGVFYAPDEFKNLEAILKKSKSTIYVDQYTVNAYDYDFLVKNCAEVKLISQKVPENSTLRIVKTDTEIEQLKDAFYRTDMALSSVRDFINENDNISEYDIDMKLRAEFEKQGAKGLSFKPIIAKDKNAALAHYSKSSKQEIITDGSLILIDCGAYFDGGLATDITRVFVKGEPSDLQRKIYTIVLKAFLRGFNYCKFNKGKVSGYDIDSYVREFLNNFDTNGFAFNHGLGHGIGINVHEAPPGLNTGKKAKTVLQDNMCFTIEPGLYKEGEFGVRLENSCYFKNNMIHSFVKMNYESKLIEYNMLSAQEKEWLEEFEVK